MAIFILLQGCPPPFYGYLFRRTSGGRSSGCTILSSRPISLFFLLMVYSLFFLFVSCFLTLSCPLDVNYVLEQSQGHGHLSKYLISGLIFNFFLVYMKKTSNPSLKKRSLDISLQHKNRASNKLSKKNFCTWPKIGLALKGLIGCRSQFISLLLLRSYFPPLFFSFVTGIAGTL